MNAGRLHDSTDGSPKGFSRKLSLSKLWDDRTVLLDYSALKLHEKIGSGFYGDVFRGNYCGAEVAVKRVISKRETTIKDFENEVLALRGIRHENVVRFIGICRKSDEEIYIVTEFINGGDLRKYIFDPAKRLSWKIILRMILDVSQAMEYIHCNNMIHRDLKTSNLLVEKDGDNFCVKVADFGVSRHMDTAVSSKGMTRPKMMTQCGTWCYMAPEVINNLEYNEKVDVFGFGICLVEIVTRKDAENIPRSPNFAVDFELLSENIPESCPQDLLALMEKCCDINPDNRPAFTIITERLTTLLRFYNTLESTDSNGNVRPLFGIKH